VFGCGLLMVYLPGITWLRFIGWQALGVALYFWYGRRHSRLANPVLANGSEKASAWTRTTIR
jgi:APA family basic amino acid/polyamine antiporter